ncbi:hypothetical protein [Ideonella livida]|uniref:Uncharacterized protein n=1 Tax=Ideonella livida TaxID=2707176 RepID=A0A7C9TMZ0_9BURK|nr:hypothetical protein [Ideonella livida]NDY93722.1 hypothetical protein [Ideonella livida]
MRTSLLLALGLIATAAQAAPTVYDNFAAGAIDPAKWNETASWRYVDGNGRLQLGRTAVAGAAADTGLLFDTLGLNAKRSIPAKSMGATLRVMDIDVPDGCATNTTQTVSTSRARVIGSLFNARPGGPVAGDRTGDVLAQVRVGRASNSTDAEGVLRVTGVLSQCTTPDCSFSVGLSSQDLGTAALGQRVKALIKWSRATNTVAFSRDGGAAKVSSYTLADGALPAVVFHQVSLRHDLPNCLSAPAPRASISAEIDDVIFSD